MSFVIAIGLIGALIAIRIFKIKNDYWLIVIIGVLGAGISYSVFRNVVASSFIDALYDRDNGVVADLILLIFSLLGSVLAILPFKFLKPEDSGKATNFVEINMKNKDFENIKVKEYDINAQQGENMNKFTYEEINQLKDQLAENNIDVVIENLQNRLKNNPTFAQLYDELIMIRSRTNQIESAVTKGILTHDIENIEMNKIRDSLLNLLNRMV